MLWLPLRNFVTSYGARLCHLIISQSIAGFCLGEKETLQRIYYTHTMSHPPPIKMSIIFPHPKKICLLNFIVSELQDFSPAKSNKKCGVRLPLSTKQCLIFHQLRAKQKTAPAPGKESAAPASPAPASPAPEHCLFYMLFALFLSWKLQLEPPVQTLPQKTLHLVSDSIYSK